MTNFPFDIVGFDVDGTLLDSHADLAHGINHALDLAGRPALPIDTLRSLIGGGGRTMLRRALELTGGVEDASFAQLHHQFLEHYAANIAVHTRLFPGGETMLDELAARGVRLAVVSNKLESLTRALLDDLGLASRFFTVIGGDTLGPGRAKPARDLIDLMLERGGGGRAAFVGDTSFDVGAARAAGIPVVAVSFGFNDVPAPELGADCVIDHFDALIPALLGIA
jgi:phosphoglycolate phosphatase